MGGTLGVNSRLGEGSVFRVEIPVEAVSTLAEAQAGGEQRAVAGYRRSQGDGALRILVVDDLAENRQVLRGLLEPLGFLLEEAENGQRCLEIAPQFRPDVVLMDVRMPVMGGLEAARVLRERSPRLPIVVLSASAFAEDHRASLRAGSDAHLDKPVRLPELLETLARLLPLQWIYQESALPGEETGMEALSAEQAARFSRLIKSGDMSGMEKFAGQLCASCPVFAARLARLARDFDIGGLLELERAYRHEAETGPAGAGENSTGG
jgi:CheY-like chemotaxis protein